MRRLVAVAVALAMVSPACTVWAEEAFVLVVHPSNSVRSIKRADLGRMFLRKLRLWTGEAEIKPVDQSERSSVRASFSKSVLGRSAGVLALTLSSSAAPTVCVSSSRD